jgi:hypothetical protein
MLVQAGLPALVVMTQVYLCPESVSLRHSFRYRQSKLLKYLQLSASLASREGKVS